MVLVLFWLWLTFTSREADISQQGAAPAGVEFSVTLTPTRFTDAMRATGTAESAIAAQSAREATSVIPTEIGTAIAPNTPTLTLTLVASATSTELPPTAIPQEQASATPTPTASFTPSPTLEPQVMVVTATPETVIVVTATPDAAAPTIQPLPPSPTPTPVGEPSAVDEPPAQASLTGFAIATPVNGEVIQPGDLIVSGVGLPGSQVQILDNDAVIAAITVNQQGQWRFTYQPQPGEHRFQVRPVNQPELASPVITVTVLQPIVAPANRCTVGTRSGDNYIVGTCETLADISEVTNVELPDLLDSNPNINPNLIFPGQVIQLP